MRNEWLNASLQYLPRNRRVYGMGNTGNLVDTMEVRLIIVRCSVENSRVGLAVRMQRPPQGG